MPSRERKKSGNSIMRAVFVAISFLLQLGWILLMVLELHQYSTAIALISNVVAAVAVLRLYSKHTNNAFKMPWIMLIMALPVMGMSLYLMTSLSATPKAAEKILQKNRGHMEPFLRQAPQTVQELSDWDAAAATQSNYLTRYGNAPVYGNTDVTYYGEASDAFAAMKTELEKAESFIFMEYFIVEDGQSFEQLQKILVRKAQQGVEVRLMYDDIGSIGYVNMKFAQGLNRCGVKCQIFNPALPFLNLFLNHRDHRKITVIDGKVGFTGGYNLADEYFGISKPYGKWKDTGIRLEGEAVRSLTATFLELWNIHGGKRENWDKYLSPTHSVAAKGFVQPFGDSPLDQEPAAENVYLNLIAHAKKSIYFMTPYLIITDELTRALGLAAKRGVDVRIITPGIPDKKTVYGLTRSYYAGLAKQGVRIFEYTPGFCHGKQCVCDGELASIGTSNLDFRSLYLHFENNVVLYGCDAVKDMEKDFLELFPQCREVTDLYRSGRSAALRIWQCVLRLFAPMM